MNTGIYIRVSTEEQATEGYSISAQKDKLIKYCSINEWTVTKIYIDEGISGKNIKNRPQMKLLVNDVKDNIIENILVYKLDRLTRSTKDLIDLMDLFNEYKCNFNSLSEQIDTSTPTGRMFVKMLGIFAELERETIAERVSFGLEQKAKEGNYINNSGVYGYDVVKGKLIINEKESCIVKEIFNMYVKYNSVAKIVKHLNLRKISTKRKQTSKWQASTVKSILKNSIYIGKIEYDKKNKKGKHFIVEGNHTAIIEEEVFYKVKEIMKNRYVSNVRKTSRENVIFGHSIYCSTCGSRRRIQVFVNNIKNKKYTNYSYRCNYKGIGLCDEGSISEKKIEIAFIEYIKQFQLNKHIDLNARNDKIELKNKIKTLIKNKDNVKERIKRTQYLLIDGKIDDESYIEIINEQNLIKEKLNEEIQDLQNEINNEYFYTESDMININEYVTRINTVWSLLDNKEKRIFINQFIKKIHVHKENGNIVISSIEWY